MIVAVQLESIELQHKPLKYAVRLEGDGAIEISLVLRRENGPVYLPVEIPQEVVFADVAHENCNTKRRNMNFKL